MYMIRLYRFRNNLLIIVYKILFIFVCLLFKSYSKFFFILLLREWLF